MIVSAQSQNIINGKDSDKTSHVVLLPSTCRWNALTEYWQIEAC